MRKHAENALKLPVTRDNYAANGVGLALTLTGTSCEENFQTGFVVAGGGFLSYWNHQLIKFEEEKRFGL